ncbi:MAG: DNA translocase FtsK 4TM domain-containing protein [Acidobacteria bacterium]|uniref:DNA translocase FtsK 4TM domain-containing protein n=1 Tax=Candidatus Polarisedimenticola svalbardensis TaxID=2886004 RepID=A0A8J6XQR3_9BACT|nr:DNA translocase FtsK 4TM domain-containing protein [Candidatus Polarisedimenticola svalbardensis]
MATSKKSWKKSRRIQELIGIVLLFVALVSIMSLLSYDQGDATWFSRQTDDQPRSNWVGWAGATLSEALLQLLGTSALLIPIFLAAAGWTRLRYPTEPFALGAATGLAGLTLALSSLTDLLFRGIIWGGEEFAAGGYLGNLISRLLVSIFNRPGAFVFSAALVAAVVVLVTRVSFSRILDLLTYGAGRLWFMVRSLFTEKDRTGRTRPVSDPTPEPSKKRKPIPYDGGKEPPTLVSKTESKPVPPPAARRATPRARQQGLPLHGMAGGGYSLPPLELLKEPEPQKGDNESDLLSRADLLTEKFAEFAVAGKVVAIHPGPVVTTFEFEPDSGVRFSKVTALVEDLCLALRAVSIRIDRIPGKSTVGIEVPNERQEIIYPKQLIDSAEFNDSESKLTMALGKDIGGEVFVTDLDKMPHLLIAGATGAGKSVGLNGMITSILYKSTPDDVRFIMIDTKMIELGIYADIPHLLIPVVTEPKAASTALKWAVREMGKRYKRLASVGVRNLGQFNELLLKEPDRTMTDDRSGAEIPLHHLPYIVIIIDEMADLMMVASADVEESVMRLAQMARAVGIHLILATQRPSVDVITGTIKANFPSRIAFRVSQRVDSRTIIDRQGAEHLLGRGDMLFLPPGSARLIRLHGGYITEAELNRITTFLKKTAKPDYDDAVLKEEKEERGKPGNEERDEFFIKAVEVVLQEGQCSITMIQRRLRLGYARAARIVDAMEQAGIVGPPDGARPREVLAGPDILEELEASGQ